MPNYNNIKELFTDICNSIRNKTGETGLINHTDIPLKIDSIQTGGGGEISPEINMNYIRYCEDMTDSEAINAKLNEIVQHINQTNDFLILDRIFEDVNKLNFDFSLFRDRIISSSYMFYSSDLKTIPNIEKLDTSNIIDMSYMFYYCSTLTSLDLSNFNTSKCKSIQYMFHNCTNLTSVDLSNFDTTNIVSTGNMFFNCSKLAYLKLGKNFIPNTITYSVFNSSSYQNIEIDMDGNPNFSSYNGNATFDLSKVWNGTDETKINKYILFANSLGIKDSTYNRTIKINTNLYNVLTDEQKALTTDKGYILSYGT